MMLTELVEFWSEESPRVGEREEHFKTFLLLVRL